MKTQFQKTAKSKSFESATINTTKKPRCDRYKTDLRPKSDRYEEDIEKVLGKKIQDGVYGDKHIWEQLKDIVNDKT